MAGSLVFGALATDIVDSGLVAGIVGNETQFTVMLWCFPTTFTANRVLWARGGGNARFVRITATGEVQAGATRTGGNTTYSTTSTPLVLNTWCFIAVTFDLSAGAGLKIQFSSGLEGVPATACTFAVTTETGTTLTDDSLFHSFWGNNSPGLASPFQGSIAYPAWFSGILSLAEQRLYQAAPRQVVASRVAADFKLFGLAAADAFDFSGNVAGTVTGATQGTGPSTSLVVSKYAANRALLTAMGVTDLEAFSVKDSRLCLKTDRTSWFDAMAPQGTTNSRAQGVTATGSNVPTVASEGVVFDGVNDILASAQDARLLFSAATPLYCLTIAKATGNGFVCGASSDPTSAVTYPIGGILTDGGKWKARWTPTGAGQGIEVKPDSGLAWNDGLVRASYVGKTERSVATTNGDDGMHYGLIGRQSQPFLKNTAATVVAGGLKESFGGQGGTFTAMTVYWQMWLAKEMSPAIIAAFKAFAQTEFGATVETSVTGQVAFASDSLWAGTQSTNPLSRDIGSGTTTPPYLVVNTATSHGTLASLIGLTDVHQYNTGNGGRTCAAGTAQFAHELGAVFDGLRTGRKVLYAKWITNDERVTQTSFAQLKTDMQAYYAAAVAAGVTLIQCTTIDYGSGLVGAANGCYANAYPDLTLSSEGTIVLQMNAELRANRALYCDRLIDLAANAAFAPGTWASHNATYYQNDFTHLQDAGYVLMGSLMLTDTVQSGYFWPLSAGTIITRRRRR